jgi:hypothetical protein
LRRIEVSVSQANLTDTMLYASSLPTKAGKVPAAKDEHVIQVETGRVFAIVFGVMIWAATVALLEVRVSIFWFWKAWGMTRQVWRRLSFVFSHFHLPLPLPSQLQC